MEARVRLIPEQSTTLLEFMETHGDLARPSAGPHGRIRSDQLWSELTDILNSVSSGVSKTTDKWKKAWADWKSKTKKKARAIKQHSGRTGGGPALSTLDKRVLALIRKKESSVKELGFNRSQSPEQDDPPAVDHTMDLEIEYEVAHLSSESSQSSTSEPSKSWHVPSSSAFPMAPQSPPAPEAPTPPAPVAPTTVRRRRPPPTPPPARRGLRLRSPQTLQSAGSSARPRFRARRGWQAPPYFERAESEFTTVELRRLEIEETRLRHQHERDLRALEIEHERNEVFRSITNVAQAWLDYYRSRDNPQPVKKEH